MKRFRSDETSTGSLGPMGTNDSGPIRVGVLGVAGRMGRAVADAVHEADGLTLVAAADPSAPGSEVNGVTVAAGVEDLLDAGSGVDVVVDFTVAEASRATLPVLAAAGVHAVVGTSGLGQQVYIGLGDGDFGVGMTAGIGMAIIAIIADRMTAAWSVKLQERYTSNQAS